MSSTHISIVTGASRGMGLAIARQLLREGHRLLCISRSVNTELATAARDGQCEQWREDLADAAPVAARLGAWLAALDGNAFRSVTLINNAAAIPAIVPLQAANPPDLVRTLRVGLEAPMLLTAAFLRGTVAWPARAEGACKVLNISSGLGRRAMASQASYCAVKAGLDHFTRSVALDQGSGVGQARIVSLAPGVIETDMQVHLRGSDPSQFPDHARFVELKSAGHLDSPEAAATKVIDYLRRADFGSNPVADVRDP